MLFYGRLRFVIWESIWSFPEYLNVHCIMLDVLSAFYRAVNAIFGKVGRVASDEIILQLIKSKHLPILLFRIFPVNQKRSKFTGFCNKPDFYESL